MPTPPPDYDSQPYTMREYYGPSLGWSQSLVPTTGPGGGVQGPPVSVVGDIATWNSTNGTLLADTTYATITSRLSVFTSTTQGVVPASGGTVNYVLTSNGTWVNPATLVGIVIGATTVTNGVGGRIIYDNSGIAGEYSIPLSASYGGTNSAFTAFAGATGSVKTYTVPNSSQTLLCSDLADQTISGGANVSSATIPTGNYAVDCGKCPLQYITNNGAFTLTAPSLDGNCILLITNGASAGTITFSGWSVPTNPGDALTTTNGQKFSITIWRINGTSGYRVAAHQ